MSTTYYKSETSDVADGGSGHELTLTRFCGPSDPLQPDRTRVQLDLSSGSYVCLNRQQALTLAAKLLAPWSGE